MAAPKMPIEYKAKELKQGGYTKTTPRVWTTQEISWIKELKEKGFNNSEIAESIDRSEVSLQIKLKRLSKNNNTYNDKHKNDKYNTNNEYLNTIKINSVLDVFSGAESFYKNKNYKLTTNDLNKDFNTDYHEEALTLLCKEYINGNKYDLVDLDPFGSAYDCFDLAIKIAKKGLIITLGEMGQKRWQRLDFIKTHYGINTLEEFTSENLVKYIQVIGARNKKNLIVYKIKDWQNISRVYFYIEPLKVLEQWETKPKEILQPCFNFD